MTQIFQNLPCYAFLLRDEATNGDQVDLQQEEFLKYGVMLFQCTCYEYEKYMLPVSMFISYIEILPSR